MARTVGKFTLNGDGTLSGRAEYMQEQGNAKLKGLLDGTDTVFNMMSGYSPDAETAVLVALQTDYAGWLCMRQFAPSASAHRPRRRAVPAGAAATKMLCD